MSYKQPKQKPKISQFEQEIISIGGLAPKIDDIEIGENLDEFYRIRKHYLILTDAGKPVYTRYGDEMMLAPFIATLSAVIPKILNYFWDNKLDARSNTNRISTI